MQNFSNVISALNLSRCLAKARFLALLLLLSPLAGVSPVSAANAPPPKEATLEYNFRPIFTFRAKLLGLDPEVRASRSYERIKALTPTQMLQPTSHKFATVDGVTGIMIRVGDVHLFTVLQDDLDPEQGLTQEQAAREAEARLVEALQVGREQWVLGTIVKELAWATLATVLAFSVIWLIRRATHYLLGYLQSAIDREEAKPTLRLTRHVWLLMQRLLRLASAFLWLSVGYIWLIFVLSAFQTTEPLGTKLGGFLFGLIRSLGQGLVNAVPGLLTVMLIMFLTHAVNEVIGNFFKSVEEGRTRVPGLPRETISATRRIVNILVWCFGIAVAYPYIPLSDGDSFKGLSVMLGFMLTLGSAGVVTQLMGGLVIVYSRALSVGDFVDISGTVGVVSEVGMLSTKIIDMRNEEVTIPNAVLIGNPIRNYSRLSGQRGTLVSTKVTIGYDTPWRQVYAMLIAAAQATNGLRGTPTPFVYQRGLQDFYVEYELFAYMDKPLNRVPVLSELHGNIQDQFNLNGVQIMSPHFAFQPRNNIVGPRDQWHAPPAAPPEDNPR